MASFDLSVEVCLISESYVYKCKKTAVYTYVNGDMVRYVENSKIQKKVILPSNTSPNVNVLIE